MNAVKYLFSTVSAVVLFSQGAIACPASPPSTDVKFELSKATSGHQVAHGKESSIISIELRYSGPEVANAKAIQTILTSATDDAGNPLQARTFYHDADGTYKALEKPFGKDAQNEPDTFELSLAFEGPVANKSIKSLTGNIKLFVPSKDPNSVVTVSFEKDAGKPLKNAELTAAGVEITLVKPSTTPSYSGKMNGVDCKLYDLTYQIKDPNNKVVAVDFVDAKGEKLKTTSRSSSENKNLKTKSLHFDSAPPKDATVKIYLLTDKSLVTAPFEFKDIALGKR